VTLIDENDRPGGQLIKQIHKFFGSREHMAGARGMDIGQRLLDDVYATSTQVFLGCVAWGIFEGRSLGIIRDGRNELLEAKRLLLATGAMENAIAFPGWTLPGVMGAGAIQTLMNVHRVLPGNRILMIGAGNVGLIVTYQLLQAGADVVAIIDAAPGIGGYGVHASKVRRNGVPILTSTTVKEAHGEEHIAAATVMQIDEHGSEVPGTTSTLDVDVICLSCGLSPLAELARMAGCDFTYLPELGGHLPVHNVDMETTQAGVFIAGDLAGIEEASTAIEEGRLAGVAMAESLGYLSQSEAALKKEEIRARLRDLRGGPFGEARRNAKDLITGGRVGTWRY
jgi:NADPH-dependent 2,4-dienoyl-CoA reductase/sulfur reductase-like enzyme